MLKKLIKYLTSPPTSSSSADGFFLKVRCNKCGEDFNLFIHSSASLTQEFDKQGKLSYTLNKEIIGSKCPNRIYVHMDFNGRRKLLNRTIDNGEFLED